MAKITAYRKDTGAEVRIPEHWLDHPVHGKEFRKTKPAEKPSGAQQSASTDSEAASAARKEK